MSFLAEHGVGHQESPSGGRLYCKDQHEPAAPGRAIGDSSKMPMSHLPGWHRKCSLRGFLSTSFLLYLHLAVGWRERCLPTLQAPLPVGAAHHESGWLQRIHGYLVRLPPKEHSHDPEQIPTAVLQPAQEAHLLWCFSGQKGTCRGRPRAEG